jgi:hypothetical protein
MRRAELLGFDFVDPAEIVLFDERGTFLPEATNEAVQARLKKHERAVVSGFYGSKPDGSIKTFSRGGSDITGAIVARGVGADVYENWTESRSRPSPTASCASWRTWARPCCTTKPSSRCASRASR